MLLLGGFTVYKTRRAAKLELSTENCPGLLQIFAWSGINKQNN